MSDEKPNEQDGPAALRATVDRLKAQVASLESERDGYKAQVRSMAIEAAGIDTTTGIGKAIDKLYDGEATKDKILEFAKTEFGFETAPSAEEQVTQVVTTAQGRVDQVASATTSTQESDIDAQIAEANRAGDYVRAAQLQVRRLVEAQG